MPSFIVRVQPARTYLSSLLTHLPGQSQGWCRRFPARQGKETGYRPRRQGHQGVEAHQGFFVCPDHLVTLVDSSHILTFQLDSAEFPDDVQHTLSSNEHVEVENDGEVKTQ